MHVIRYSVKMTEEKVNDLEFGLRRKFALNKNVLHFILTMTQWKPKKMKMVNFDWLVLLQTWLNYP